MPRTREWSDDLTPPMELPNGTLMKTVARRDKKRRQELREKLRAEGVNEQLIEKIVEQERLTQLAKRHGPEAARQILIDLASREPDDTGYKPSSPDPLLKGPARVTGKAAKVVKRRDTVTQFQYDRMKPT